MNEAQLHFREWEVCDRKSPGFAWITATTVRPNCKTPPAAFLISVLLKNPKNLPQACKTPHVPVHKCRTERVDV